MLRLRMTEKRCQNDSFIVVLRCKSKELFKKGIKGVKDEAGWNR
ncbi:hypothetical protein THER_0985 [Thermodesulfovibrio sp. N1]|nr:hypothetical protein THER_0985 [Thermodesulfovibrio sp. N1]